MNLVFLGLLLLGIMVFSVGMVSALAQRHGTRRGVSAHNEAGSDISRSITVTAHPKSPMDAMTNSSGQQIGLSPQAYDEMKTGKTNRAALISHSR